MINKLFSFQFIKFLLTGGLNTLFGYTVFSLFVYLTASPSLSVILANITGILFNFKTYGKFVFKTSGNSRLYRFIAAYLFLTLTQITLLKYFAYLGIDSPYYAAGILTLPMAALSYLLLSQFVFRTQTNVEKLIDESSD